MISLNADNTKIYIDNFYYDNFNKFLDNFGEANNISACLNNSGEGGEYAPENLKNCEEAYYYPDNNTYICIKCLYNYFLDNITNLCFENKDKICTIKNFGTEIMPVYDCIEWFNRDIILSKLQMKMVEKNMWIIKEI